MFKSNGNELVNWVSHELKETGSETLTMVIFEFTNGHL